MSIVGLGPDDEAGSEPSMPVAPRVPFPMAAAVSPAARSARLTPEQIASIKPPAAAPKVAPIPPITPDARRERLVSIASRIAAALIMADDLARFLARRLGPKRRKGTS